MLNRLQHTEQLTHCGVPKLKAMISDLYIGDGSHDSTFSYAAELACADPTWPESYIQA
jgi:hypothetical protein